MRGSGMLHHWKNVREGWAASKGCIRRERVGECLEKLLVGAELEGDDEGGEEVEGVLGRK